MTPSQKSRAWSAAVLLKYSLLQLPALALVVIGVYFLQQWIHLPSWVTWAASLLWIAKDVILYPFVWKAYDPDTDRKSDDLIGLTAVAKDRLSPSGYLEVRGELWRARTKGARSNIRPGEHVKILGREGLTLIVEPIEDAGEEPAAETAS